MRSITFGPTSYFESSLNQHEVGADTDDDQTQELIVLFNNLSQNLQGRLIGTQGQALPNADAQQLNNLRVLTQEVVFYSCDNLFRESLVGHRELAMKKNCKCKFSLDPQRTFQSYCYEFCGLLNIQFTDVKFIIKNSEVPFLRQIKKSCKIDVYFHSSTQRNELNQLKPALQELLDKAAYADLEIVVNGQTLKVHKCILIARSEKFKVMLHHQMKESIESKVSINNEEVTFDIYKLLIQWIYEGECDLPDSVKQLMSLLKLTDEYLLPDLQKVCEEQIVDYMEYSSAVDILTDPQLVIPQQSDQIIRDVAKSVLLEDYEKVELMYPDIEERISQVKGLMSELLTHKKKKKTHARKRRGSIIGEDGHKKKVRFNISNTIYEEASAINDESDSLIEPLSIYSNISPPGELNEDIMVSSTHSSLHNTMSDYQRRHSASANQGHFQSISIGESTASANNSAGRNQMSTGNLQSILSPQNRLLRPASAGRNDGTIPYRSSSSISLENNRGTMTETRVQEVTNEIQNQPSRSASGRQNVRFDSLM